MISTPISYWAKIINIILHSYFSELTTTCVLWNKEYDLHWLRFENTNVLLHINPWTLKESFAKDVHNFKQQDLHYNSIGVYYDDWTRKYVASIDQAKCEGFVVFQDDIPKFAQTFRRASLYAIWRSRRNKFLFAYTKETQTRDYFQDLLFKNMVNILVIESDFKNSTKFSIKTNKFVGSIYEKPNQLIHLSQFDAVTATFDPVVNLFSQDKLQNLKGREIIVGAFDYRPFVVVDFKRMPQYYDYAADNPRHLAHIEGTELHILHTFCAIYNCTVQVDTTEKEEWGMVYSNYTANGLLGMLLEGKIHMAMGALFLWDVAYQTLDHTNYMGRSGVTCLVPVPKRVTDWTLPLKPFQFTLWLAVISYIIFEALSLFLARQFEETLLVVQPHGATCWSSVKFGYTTALKMFVAQGTAYNINSNTLRTVLTVCSMIHIIIGSIYGGGLAAILTIPSLKEAADSVERLYRHNLTWAATSYDWVVSIDHQDEKDPDLIVKRLVRNFRIYSMEELRLKAKTENMGFVLERLAFGHFGNGEFITPQALDHLKLMVDDIYYAITVAMVPRLWPHLPKYNDLISIWLSSGLSKFWEWKITADYMNAKEQGQVAASKHTNINKGPVKLNMENFAGLALLWLVGVGLSILVFMGEWVVYLMNKKK